MSDSGDWVSVNIEVVIDDLWPRVRLHWGMTRTDRDLITSDGSSTVSSVILPHSKKPDPSS
jgi:hypothetical protein